MDVRINQTLKDFGMIAWNKREGLQTRKLRKGTLHLQKKGNKPQGKYSDVSKVECYNCHKFGHFSRDCRLPKNKFKRRFQAFVAKEEE